LASPESWPRARPRGSACEAVEVQASQDVNEVEAPKRTASQTHAATLHLTDFSGA
jgi:hypothetical protein